MLVTTRKATADDAPTLAQLRWRWRNEERDAPGDRAAFVEFFTAWVLDHQATHLPFVAEVDGEVCGMAFLALAERVPSPTRPARHTGDLQSVYVVPERRNNGVGAALIATILDHARGRQLELVTVHSAQRAVPFYLRHGFSDGQNWLQWSAELT